MWTKKVGVLAIGACAAIAFAGGAAQAASVMFNIEEFTTGADFDVKITLEDVGTDVKVSVDVVSTNTGNIGDLRGVFFHINDESLVSGLSASGTDLTEQAFDANNVDELGGGASLSGYPGGKFDGGVEIGTPGIIGATDIQNTTFILSHTSADLDITNFSSEVWGVRATSIGSAGGRRTGGAKLAGTAPAPTVAPVPAAAWMGLVVLGGLGGVKKIRSRRSA